MTTIKTLKTKSRELGFVPHLKCNAGSEFDLITQEPLKFANRDVIVLLMESKYEPPNNFKGQCLYRKDLNRIYNESNIYKPYPEKINKLVKLPHIGVWAENAELVFNSKHKHCIFILKDFGEHPIGSEFGFSTMHGTLEKIYRIENFIPNKTRRSWLSTRKTGKRKTIEDWDLDRMDRYLLQGSKNNHPDDQEEKEDVNNYYIIDDNKEEKFPLSRLINVSDAIKIKIISNTLTTIPNIANLQYLECERCENLTEISNIDSLLGLTCTNCPLLRSIPNISTLKTLFLSDCQSITEIPNMPALDFLRFVKCGNLRSTPVINSLKSLECINCTSLQTIQEIPNLTLLNCSGCTLISNIPNLPNLFSLDCSGCPLITSIPNIVGLKHLNCSSCRRLRDIPNIEGLTDLICHSCRLLITIPNITTLRSINCDEGLIIPDELENDDNVYKEKQ